MRSSAACIGETTMAPFSCDPVSSHTERQPHACRTQGQGAGLGRPPPEEVRRRPVLLRYGVAVATIIMVLVLRLLLTPLREAETLLLLGVAAVATSAWYGG